MKERAILAIKIFAFCYFVIAIQTSLLTDIHLLVNAQFNLVFCSLVIFASRQSLYENILVSCFFCILTSMLLYDKSIFWLYPLFSFIAFKINPKQISDKFLICVLYTIFFTPLYELFSQSSLSYLDRVSESILANIAIVPALYLIVKLTFKKNKTEIQF